MSNPLVAQKQDSTTAISGITILEGGKAIKDGIENGDWASTVMGAVGVGMDALAFVADPFGSILAAGVGWLMEHVGPLKEALDKLAGDPDQIKAHSETWANISKEVSAVSTDLANQIKADIQSWTGPGADAYRAQGEEVAKTLEGAAQACDGASSGVKTAGEVVAAVRMLVRDIIAQVVGHMISWALQVLFTLGIGLTWVVPQVVNLVAKTAKQIAELVKSLTKALKALGELMGKAGKLFADAGKALKGLKPGSKATPDKVDTLPSGAKGIDSPGGKGGGETTPSGAGKDGEDTPPPKTGDETTPSGAPKDGDGGGTPKGDPEGSPNGTPKDGDTTPSGAKPNPPRDGATGKDDWVCKTDPVDVLRGNVIVDEADLELPSPLVLERLHVSSYRAGRWFGPSWTSTVDQRLEVDDEHICFVSADGMRLLYPHSSRGAVLPLEGPRRPLTPNEDGGYTLSDPLHGKELHFGALPGRGRGELALLAITDAGGARVDIDYDTLGAPRVLRHSDGYRVELEIRGGRITEIRVADPERDFRVLVRRFGYDQQGRLTQVFNSSGRPHTYDYDQAGRITGWQDRNGVWYRYVYDAEGRCVRTVGDRGFYDGSFEYNTQQRVTAYTDSLGHTSEYHFNEAGQLVREVDPLGHVTVSEWDRYDRLLSRTDPLGRTTRYEYTDEGALTAVIRPDGSRARVARDPDGTLTITVTSGGRDWQRVYPPGTAPDLFAAPVAATFDQNTQWGPQPAADPGKIPVPDAVPDLVGDPVERDLFGRPRVVTDLAGGHTRLDWTIDGRLAGRIGPLGRREEWRYDAEGNRVEEGGDPHRRTRYEYGPFDLPVAAIDATGGRTTYEYDTELRLIRITNPLGLSWHYTYDAVGRPIEERDYDGRVLRFGYDAAGQLVRSVNGLGEVTTYAYDVLGNLVARTTPAGVTTYAYDPVGLLARATEAGSVLEIERDERGRVVRESVDGRAVSYRHEPHVLHRRTPSGVDSAWTFDDNGNAISLAVGDQVVSFRYDAAGREIERTTAGGAALTQTFDAEHQLTGQTVTDAERRVVQQRRYSYHVDGHLTGVDDAVSGPVRYGFDSAGRVTDVSAPDGAETYRYDASGNIGVAQDPVAGPAGLGHRSYTGNRLSAAGSVSYTHDPQGRLVARRDGDRIWAYSWDPQDRLVGVRTPDGTTWRYRYDPIGRRIAKQRLTAGPTGHVVAEEIQFVWSGQNLVEEIHHDGQGRRLVLTWDHHPGTTRPVTQTEQLGTGVRFFSFVTDPIGTPVDMIDSQGGLAWHGTTTLWGKAKPRRTTGASTPLRFPGQYADDETGLHYNVFRYYDPGTGRYLSQDPLGLAPAPDPVNYVPDPLLQADPLGLGCGGSKEAGAGSDGPTPPPRQPASNDATNVQNSNPVSKLPADVKPKDDGPKDSGPKDNGEGSSSGKQNEPHDNGEGSSSAKPDNTPPKSEFDTKMQDYKDKLDVKSDPAVFKIPDDPNIKLNTPVKDLPDDMKHGLKPEDENKTVGEMMGLPKDAVDEPEFGNAKAHDFLDMQGGAGYNPRDNAVSVQAGKGDNEIYHELGHVKQNEDGGFTTQNTNRSILEYENVLKNENKINPDLRDNYALKDVPPGLRNKTWDQMMADVNKSPAGDVRTNNQAVLNQIDDMLKNDPRYQGQADTIRKNLASEYFYYK